MTMRIIRDSTGSTLIELTITVVIVGVLGIVAIPRFTAVANEPIRAEAVSTLERICTVADAVKSLEGAYPASLEDGTIPPESSDPYYEFYYEAGVVTAVAKDQDAYRARLEMDCTSRTTT